MKRELWRYIRQTSAQAAHIAWKTVQAMAQLPVALRGHHNPSHGLRLTRVAAMRAQRPLCQL